MLPPGTISALKGYPNEIVISVVSAMAIGGMAIGIDPWPIVAVVAVVLTIYDKRSSSREKHDQAMAARRVEEAVAKADAVKAKYQPVRLLGQQDLQLEREPGQLIDARQRPGKPGK